MEKDIESKLREEVTKLKGLCIKLWPLSFTGLPDRLILLPNGRVFFRETKFNGGQLRPRQVIVQKQLTDLGFDVGNIRNIEDIHTFIKKVKK